MRGLHLLPLLLAGCMASQLPPPKEPVNPSGDGFPEALARGCRTVEGCAVLEQTAEARYKRCEQDFAAFSREAERRGYTFQSGQPATCPLNVAADVDTAHEMHERSVSWADALGELPTPVTSNLRRDMSVRGVWETQQSMAREASAQAEKKREEIERGQAEVAAANERDVLAGTRAGLVAASIALCERRAELADLKSQRAEMLRLDRASGTMDLAERRDLAAEIINDEDVVACGATIIRKRWRAAPLACPKAEAESEAEDVQKLLVGGYQRELIDCDLAQPEAGQ
jgi:hypothetical protein